VGVVTPDTGFGHLASGVYGKRTLLLIKSGSLHWKLFRNNVNALVVDESDGVDAVVRDFTRAIKDAYSHFDRIRADLSTLFAQNGITAADGDQLDTLVHRIFYAQLDGVSKISLEGINIPGIERIDLLALAKAGAAVKQADTGSSGVVPNAGMEVPKTASGDKGGIGPALSESIGELSVRKGGVDLRSLPIVTQPMALPLPALSMNTRVPLSAQEAKELEEEFGAIEKMVSAGIIPSTDRLKDYLGNCYDKQGLEASVDKVLACIADILRLEEERCLSTETALKELLQLLESDKPQEQFKLSLNAIKPLAQEVPGLDEFTYEDRRNE
jgi:hypothetical protein